jgi:hypothetical protein
VIGCAFAGAALVGAQPGGAQSARQVPAVVQWPPVHVVPYEGVWLHAPALHVSVVHTLLSLQSAALRQPTHVPCPEQSGVAPEQSVFVAHCLHAPETHTGVPPEQAVP